MDILWAILLCVINLVWVATIILGLPGTWMVVLTTLAAGWVATGPVVGEGGMFSTWTIIALVVLAGLGEVGEFAAGVAGSKKAGGTRWGAVGAILGGIVGGIAATFVIPVPVIGSLIGACAGAALGAGILEMATGQAFENALKSGYGAGVGRFFGTVIKLGIGGAMWLIAGVAAFRG